MSEPLISEAFLMSMHCLLCPSLRHDIAGFIVFRYRRRTKDAAPSRLRRHHSCYGVSGGDGPAEELPRERSRCGHVDALAPAFSHAILVVPAWVARDRTHSRLYL